jgi:hypothetical protein
LTWRVLIKVVKLVKIDAEARDFAFREKTTIARWIVAKILASSMTHMHETKIIKCNLLKKQHLRNTYDAMHCDYENVLTNFSL